jgi:YD repeat-containing protein
LTQGTGQPWVKTWYDRLGRETIVESIGAKEMTLKTQKTYNAKGQLTQTQKTTGNITITDTCSYDARGRVLSHSSTNGQSVSYAYGNRQVTTTTNGRQYIKTYDAWGNVLTSSDSVSSVTYSYHSSGQPGSVSSGGATWTMTYDDRGNQLTLDDPNAGTTTYAYDAFGRVIQQTDARGNVTENVYDALGRLDYSTQNGETTDYTYGTSGTFANKLTKIQTGANSVSYTYNSYGRVIKETRVVEGVSGADRPIKSYIYNSCGQLESITHRQLANNLAVNREYDAYGNLSKVKVGNQTVWELTGNTGAVQTTQLGSTMTATKTFNSQGRLSQLRTVKGSAVLRDFTYIFDAPTGNLTSRSGMFFDPETFVYDNLDRLTDVKEYATTLTHVNYATNGNITSKTGLGASIGAYSYNSNNKPHALREITNIDDRNGEFMLQNTAAAKYSYSLRTIADFKTRILEHDFAGMLLEIESRNRKQETERNEVFVQFVGKFNAYNLTAVFGATTLLESRAKSQEPRETDNSQFSILNYYKLSPHFTPFQVALSQFGRTALLPLWITPTRLTRSKT